MEILVFSLAVFIILSGISVLVFLIGNSVISRDVHTVYYSPHSENETEYGVRTLLFLYPNAVINTTRNRVSERLEEKISRVITHQEI